MSLKMYAKKGVMGNRRLQRVTEQPMSTPPETQQRIAWPQMVDPTWEVAQNEALEPTCNLLN